MKRLLLLLLAVSALLIFSSCRKSAGAASGTTTGSLSKSTFPETDEVTNFVKIEMENGGIMLIELYPDVAPITVKNFQDLVAEHFYDGIIFHRVIYSFMIQGGDPDGDGIGGSDKTIKGEFALNGVENNLKHTRGVLSMARTNAPNSASSQFFIMHADAPHLDGSYAAFGKVIDGLSVVDEIASVQTNASDRPLIPQRMKTVRFVTVEEVKAEADTTA